MFFVWKYVVNKIKTIFVQTNLYMLLRLLHLFLSFCVLSSSVGISISEHKCSRKGRQLALFNLKALSCCSSDTSCTVDAEPCHKTPFNSIKRKPCCEDHKKYFQQTLKATKEKQVEPFVWTDIAPDKVYYPTPVPSYNVLNAKLIRLELYKPPPLCRDIALLVQSFRC